MIEKKKTPTKQQSFNLIMFYLEKDIRSIKTNLNIIDLTGAGDLFAAGFLHGYINGLQTKDSLEKGTELSSKIIQKMGARL